jgi:hypothetical protein
VSRAILLAVSAPWPIVWGKLKESAVCLFAITEYEEISRGPCGSGAVENGHFRVCSIFSTAYERKVFRFQTSRVRNRS